VSGPPGEKFPGGVTPRDVADKSPKPALGKAVRLALAVESEAVRRNTQTFNRNRYTATAAISDYEALKDEARAVKEKSLAGLPGLLATLEQTITSRGGHFFLAQDAAQASAYIRDVCLARQARLVVKGKSMTSEEIGLNGVLEAAGMEVVETDLAEFILQVSGEQPSHIVAPAIHRSRERISSLFKRVFDTNRPLETGEDLTAFARDHLRLKFLSADVGISGANVIAAASGTLVLVESEGNIRMATLAPPVHIAIAGVEKVVPHRRDLAPFIELLAPSGTGQPLTAYTSIIDPPFDFPSYALNGPPTQQREFHLVLLDNGRLDMLRDPDLAEALLCVRCSACLNVCANFQAVGGHAFGGKTYSGGIGGAWEAGTGQLEAARFSELCTGCTRCVPNCPVRIDIPWLNTVLRDRLNLRDGLSLQKRFFADYYRMAAWGSRLAPVSNTVASLWPLRWLLERIVGLHRRRKLPPFVRQTLTDRHRAWQRALPSAGPRQPLGRAVLLADVYTNYTQPGRGMAAAKVLHRLGVEVTLSKVLPDGRAALSQGMIDTAARRTRAMAAYLSGLIDDGHDVVVLEPSVLALFHHDNRHLLGDPALFEKIKAHTFEVLAYIDKLLRENGLDLAAVFKSAAQDKHRRLFYHSHCQQRSIGAAQPTVDILRALGYDVATSTVECCGMAGSFGYKKQDYDLSMRVGADLLDQINASQEADGDRLLVASGVSCHDQITEGTGRPVLHPVELLVQRLTEVP